jgi:hypothetical protein
MSTFYYWLPVEGPTNSAKLLERLRACGLGYAFDGQPTKVGSERGPDGMRGVVCCQVASQTHKTGYYPESQTWKKVPGTDVWCGIYTAAMPTADDLTRKEQVSGEWVSTEDGNNWLAPKARRWFEYEGALRWTYNLPQCMTLDEEGQWVTGGIKAKFKHLWELACAYESADADADGTYSFTVDQLNRLAIAALQVNYRIGDIELDILGIFDQEFRQRLIDVLLDVEAIVAWSKKNRMDHDGGSS